MQLACLVMAGGRGERFWPASVRSRPKQLLTFGRPHPLIVQAVKRVSSLVPASRVLIITNAQLVQPIHELLPELGRNQIIGEPVGRDTAPCIGVAATWMAHHFGSDCVMVALSADHHIARGDLFVDVLRAGTKAAVDGHLVTIGLKPTRPETGYGYLELGPPLDKSAGLYRVARFLEKPDPAAAEEFLASGHHLWNGGIFLWTCSRILEELRRHLPELAQRLETYRKALGTPEADTILDNLYPQFPSISIDYAVMEKADDVVTLEADVGWDDLGSWNVLERLHEPDAEGNVLLGPHVGLETRGCIVSVDKGLVATLGTRDLVIVKEGDVVLVMPKSKAAELKKLVARLSQDPKWETRL